MKKIILFVFFISFYQGICQRSNDLLSSSKVFYDKALLFHEMPNFDDDSANYYFEKSKKILLKKPNDFGFELAQIYYHQSKYSVMNNSLNALDSLSKIGWSYFEKSSNRKKNQQFEYEYLINWATIKQEKSQKKESIALFSKAMLIAKNFKSKQLEAKINGDKGAFYQRFALANEQKNAISYLLKAKNYYESNNAVENNIELTKVYASLISFHTDNNVDSVFHYSDKMKSILKYSKIPQKHAWYYVTTGRDLITYPLDGTKTISKAQYAQGKENIVKALQLLERYKVTKNPIIPYGYGLLADLYKNEKNYDLAIINYNKSHEGYQLLQNYKGASDINVYLAKTYHEKGDLKTALNYYTQYFEQTIKYEKASNERGLRESELKVDLVTKQKELVQKSNQQIFFLVVISLCLVSLLLFYRNVRLKQKTNLKLAHLNEDLENKNHLLDAKNAENELLLREIHHRVKNNLEVVSSLLALQSSQIEDDTTKNAMIESQNRVNSIGIVHQKLYQGSNLGAVEMKDYFLNLSESILDSFGAEQRIDLQLAMENLDLDIDTAVPLGLIVNELLTNCVKYAFPTEEKGTITIKLHKQDNLLRLEVADNGVGKSGITHGTGFGGQLVSLLTQQLNGTMTEESNNGTKLVFDFKLKAA